MSQSIENPHAYICWKGTETSLEVFCTCGCFSIFNDKLVNFIECPKCGKKYFCNGHIELTELNRNFDGCIVGKNIINGK